MVKLVAALRLETLGAVNPVSAVVLQVTLNRVPNEESGWTKMVLFAVTAVVFTVQVPAEALVAQENDPVGAPEQEATEGLAPVPLPAHRVVVASAAIVIVGKVMAPVTV